MKTIWKNLKSFYLLILAFLLLPSMSLASPEIVAKIEKEIKRKKLRIYKNHRSRLSAFYVKSLADSIAQHSSNFKIPSDHLIAIFSQESNFDHYAVNKRTKAAGIGQVFPYTAKLYKLNYDKIKTDLDYSVYSAALIYNWFYYTYKKKGVSIPFKRYNCGTKPTCINWKEPTKYWANVRRTLEHIK